MLNLNACKLFFDYRYMNLKRLQRMISKLRQKTHQFHLYVSNENSFRLLSRYEEIIRNLEHVNINPLKIPYCYHEDTDTNSNLRSIPM